jgi:predicted ATPase/class 3 adenylate cyclase
VSFDRWLKGSDVHESPAVTTYLFTDIEGSTSLWEQEPERMRIALARHDSFARDAVEDNRGVVVKTLGDGVHAVFEDPINAVAAAIQLQLALTNPEATAGISLFVRCGLHAGVDERRDNDFYGTVVNRAARIAAAAHGGQILLSQAVALLVDARLPAGVDLRDLGLIRLRGLASPERVHQILDPRLRMDFPALRSLETTPNNLPQQVTSFIGRERELAEVKGMLADSRMLTLLGVGGLGKTRLSLQVAADLMDEFSDGVWFVDLAPLADESLVPQSIATVLAVKEEAGRPVLEAVERYVADRNILLILDNCEHLTRACAETAKRLLQSGAQLKILASSREHLHLAGETTFSVPILSVPDAHAKITADALRQYDSARLFLERATAARRGFQLTDRNASAVADICRRLDGIPLAIELAAARTNALSAEQIAERLSDRFRLLTRGDRTALPRQQTLRALIDWSYDLLTDEERALLRRLAVFAGGWTLDAAEVVGAHELVAKAAVLDLLTNLVEKSLVVSEADSGRYRFLETVREYALERLGDSGEGVATRERHLLFFLALVEKAWPELVGPNQVTWLKRLDLDRDNILAAHTSCDHVTGGGEFGLRLASSVKRYWLTRGLLGLGYRLTVQALNRPDAGERSQIRCRALFDAGQLSTFMGRYKEAQEYLEESLAIARATGDRRRMAMALQPLGIAHHGQGDVTTAKTCFEEALALARELGDKREIAAALNALAQLHRVEGKLDVAEPLYERVVALVRELGDRESIAIGLLNLTMVSIGRGAVDRAQTMLLEALNIADEIGSKRTGQSALEVAAGLAAQREDWYRTSRIYGAAEARTAETGLHRDPADEAFLAPLIAQTCSALGATEFAAGENAGRSLSYDEAMTDVREWLERRQ